MKFALVATLAAAGALFAASMLGTAVAEAPTTTSLRTTSVEGVAIVGIAQNADGAAANAAYRQAMASAITDGQSKAEFLTGKVGATLGAVQTVTESGGEVECTDGNGEYAEYAGERPDFGNAPSATPVYATPNAASSAPSATSVQPKRSTAKKRKHHKRPVAKKATATTCKLSAQVALVYVIG
jgi:hypothetical protein